MSPTKHRTRELCSSEHWKTLSGIIGFGRGQKYPNLTYIRNFESLDRSIGPASVQGHATPRRWVGRNLFLWSNKLGSRV